ncbi:MAG: hypothetical protein ACK5I7_07350, partial [Anaerotignum sp.]
MIKTKIRKNTPLINPFTIPSGLHTIKYEVSLMKKINYNRERAVSYAHQWAFGRNPHYYNF